MRHSGLLFWFRITVQILEKPMHERMENGTHMNEFGYIQGLKDLPEGPLQQRCVSTRSCELKGYTEIVLGNILLRALFRKGLQSGTMLVKRATETVRCKRGSKFYRVCGDYVLIW